MVNNEGKEVPEFETRDVIKPIMNFIKQCPFLEKYGIDMSDIGVQKVLKEKPDATSLDYGGSTLVSSSRDLNTRMFSVRQSNFQIWLLRKSNHDILREEITEFLFNFEQWVEHCQAYNATPKISQTFEGKVEEFMWADNGVYFSEWEGEQSSLYVIQLHVTYYNNYKMII